MAHIETEEEWQARMSVKTMNFIKREVYQDFPFMSVAMESLTLEPRTLSGAYYFATDGEHLYFQPEDVIRIFKSNALFLDRAFLHSLFHCLLYHLWLIPQENMDEDARRRMSLAADIAVEYLIDQLQKPTTKRILSLMRREVYERVKSSCVLPSAQAIFEMIRWDSKEQLLAMAQEFGVDDHRFWPMPENGMPIPMPSQDLQKKWEKINRQTQLMQKQGRDAGEEAAEVLASYLENQKQRRNYGDFLRQFTRMREEMKVDPDSFDYGYYYYGLKLYHNMPLIEELESRESKRIDSFVIVVDTSDSTKGELVQRFLKETADVLQSTGSFFDRAVIHLIQADDDVRDHRVLHSAQEFDEMIRYNELRIHGGGNTDFRPAFEYVRKLQETGEIKNLCGLLYFTDGKGTFPKQKPEYDVAFLFLEDYNEKEVPQWAMRLLVTF